MQPLNSANALGPIWSLDFADEGIETFLICVILGLCFYELCEVVSYCGLIY